MEPLKRPKEVPRNEAAMPLPGTDRYLINQGSPSEAGRGLVPIRMEPPMVSEGLKPPTFTAGLEPLDETALRGGPVAVPELEEQQKLTRARKRATETGL